MVDFRALHAQRRRRLRGRRPVRAEPGAAPPDPVAITRATVIATEPFGDARAAHEWMRRCSGGRDASAQEVEEAIGLVNRAVSAHRIASQDPYVRDLVVADVQRVRLGYGTGDEVVEGAWHEAYAVPLELAKRRTRRRMLSPQEEMAGMLSGRRPGGRPSEELVLRARLDLDHSRPVEAALVARAAAEALAREGHGGEDFRASAAELADAVLAGELSSGQAEDLATLVQELERAMRKRRYAGES